MLSARKLSVSSLLHWTSGNYVDEKNILYGKFSILYCNTCKLKELFAEA